MHRKLGRKRSISEVVEDYLLTHSACPDYEKSLRRTARALAEHGVRESDQLSSSSVTKFFLAIRGSTSTQAGYRRIALTLWRHAVRQGWARGPVEARPLRVRMPVVRAWSTDELTRLVNSVNSSPGTMRSGCKKSLFWRAFVLVGYESGLRLGDLLALRLDSFDCGFTLLITTTSKTNQAVYRTLSPQCAAAVHDLFLASRDGTLFAWALSRRHIKAQFKACVSNAGLTGSVRWLRRTGATACEAQSPGSASRFLCHRSPGVAARHYVDWTKVTKQPTVPPLPLEGERR